MDLGKYCYSHCFEELTVDEKIEMTFVSVGKFKYWVCYSKMQVETIS